MLGELNRPHLGEKQWLIKVTTVLGLPTTSADKHGGRRETVPPILLSLSPFLPFWWVTAPLLKNFSPNLQLPSYFLFSEASKSLRSQPVDRQMKKSNRESGEQRQHLSSGLQGRRPGSGDRGGSSPRTHPSARRAVFQLPKVRKLALPPTRLVLWLW